MTTRRSYTHNLHSCEIKAWGIQTHDLCDTSAVLYQLSFQPTGSCELWVRNIPVDGEDTSEYMNDHIFELHEIKHGSWENIAI